MLGKIRCCLFRIPNELLAMMQKENVHIYVYILCIF